MLSGSGDYNYGSPKSQMIWPQVIWPQVIGPQRSTENPDGIMNKLFGQDVQQQYRQQGAQLVANAAQQQVQQPDGGQQVVQPPAQSPVQAQQQQPGVLALDDSDNEIMKHLKHQLVVMKQDCDGRHQRINPVALTLAQVLSIITEKL
ncbi:Hypothetical predicted protein [Cloeon dipterum]|uniref:Uncharacterized protein n=1 Tax=Cloeon dipterum TaxID=197152 RepID=A0A8S1CY60_9INSE|nr:Hypothetical predicted protein [Cloeon dipterum]